VLFYTEYVRHDKVKVSKEFSKNNVAELCMERIGKRVAQLISLVQE
jgi:hypothetical protein